MHGSQARVPAAAEDGAGAVAISRAADPPTGPGDGQPAQPAPGCRSTTGGGTRFGSPISRRERYVPEAGCGQYEFHCNLSGSRPYFLHGDHAALLLFSAANVLHEEPLLGGYVIR